jgi:RNA polymerase sigma factor (sigma-70 family)
MSSRETDRRSQFARDSIDDLVQAVYLRLINQDNHALNRFKGRFEESIYRYLAVISINVVRDHFRGTKALKRPKVTLSLDDLVRDENALRAPVCDIDGAPFRSGAQRISLEQIEKAFGQICSRNHRDRDTLIYKLRYLDGLTLEEIKKVMGLEMSAVSIGALISRLNEKLRTKLSHLR